MTRRRVEVVRTYLELRDPSHLKPAADPPPDVRFERRDPCPVPLYRRLYRDVGAPWYWHDRLDWSDADLAAHLARPDVAVWEALVNGASAGFFELKRDDTGVEIAYFGLLPEQTGRGIGGPMLARAVREAWAFAAPAAPPRVWLHTCTLDSERALPSYQARGFRAYRTERLLVELDGMTVVSERMLTD